jgi:hypothetical protein
MKSLLVGALALASISSVQAQERPRLPEELAITRSIVMQDADELESSASFQFFKLPDQKQVTTAAEFEYGLTDRWELDADVPYEFVNPNDAGAANGIGDVEAAVRYGVVPLAADKPYALNLGLGFGIPTGDRMHDLGDGRLTLEPFFTASHWVGPFNAQLNCGWQRAVTNGGDEPRDDFEYNIALLYPIRGCFLVLEGNGESNHQRTKYYVTPEVVWKPIKNLQFLVAVPLGVTGAAGAYGVVATVTFELENLTGRGNDKD